MMSNHCGFKNSKPKLSTTKQTIRNALFVAFGIWLLYQIRESYTKISLSGKSVALHLNYERMIKELGRKGLVKPLESIHGHDSNLNLDDAKNPDELNDDGFGFNEPNKKEDKKNDMSFNVVKKPESISAAEGLTEMKSNKPDHTFLDENGIPEFNRARFVGNESTKSDIETGVCFPEVSCIDQDK